MERVGRKQVGSGEGNEKELPAEGRREEAAEGGKEGGRAGPAGTAGGGNVDKGWVGGAHEDDKGRGVTEGRRTGAKAACPGRRGDARREKGGG
jgi:hypothetical protein